jgi:hypothetical protein
VATSSRRIPAARPADAGRVCGKPCTCRRKARRRCDRSNARCCQTGVKQIRRGAPGRSRIPADLCGAGFRIPSGGLRHALRPWRQLGASPLRCRTQVFTDFRSGNAEALRRSAPEYSFLFIGNRLDSEITHHPPGAMNPARLGSRLGREARRSGSSARRSRKLPTRVLRSTRCG